MFHLLVYSFLSLALFKRWDSNLLLLNLQESLPDPCELLENVSERIADVPLLKTYRYPLSGLQALSAFSASRIFIADTAVISNTWADSHPPFPFCRQLQMSCLTNVLFPITQYLFLTIIFH